MTENQEIIRPVEIMKDGAVIKVGVFHRWGGTYCLVSNGKNRGMSPMPVTGGIVEFEDGSVEFFAPDQLRFKIPSSLGLKVKPLDAEA